MIDIAGSRCPEWKKRLDFVVLFMMSQADLIMKKLNTLNYVVQMSASSHRVLQTENRELLPAKVWRRQRAFFVKI